MTQVIKRINAELFAEIKTYVETHGISAASKKYSGYNSRTLASINRQPNYELWREKRRGRQSQTRRTPATAATPAISAVVPSQTVTEIKKPGHGNAAPQRSVSRRPVTVPPQYVTREEFDRVVGNLSQSLNGVKSQLGNIGRDVQSLVKEDAAFAEVDIMLRDRQRLSRWQRLKQGLREGFRS